MTTVETIDARLRDHLGASHVEIEDDSARHAGHPGAKAGGGHYNVTVVSTAFEGQNRVARHRAIYAAMGELMQQEIHALSARAFTPDEWRNQAG